MACYVVPRTPRRMLWQDMTEGGTLDNCLTGRQTLTRSSPFYPHGQETTTDLRKIALHSVLEICSI